MEYLVKPWAHQLKAIETARTLPYYGLFMETGTGKTGTTINILREKFNVEKRVLRTLIFCPPIVVKNWRAEWLKHSRIDPGKIHLLLGSSKRRKGLFEKEAYEEGDGGVGQRKPWGRIFVANYETLLMPEVYEEFCNWAPEVVIFDESHRLKNHQAKRSKLAELLANPWDKKAKQPKAKPLTYILTGTPVLNSPMDIFQQCKILDGGKTFGHNVWAFRARYFRDRNAGMPKQKYFPKWEICTKERESFDALAEISAKLATISFSAKKKECLDLPPLVTQMLRVGMTPEQTRLYDEMKKDFLTFMGAEGGNPLMATLAITKALRLMQITSGYGKTTDQEEIEIAGTPKKDALKELLEELTPNHKVLVWAVWKCNYRTIKRVLTELGIKFVEVHGDISEKQRSEAVDAFNMDPSVRVFLGHPGSGGIGINLIPADYSIFYSRNFSLEQSLQAEARNYRGGSEIHEKVTRIDLVVENTIDELITEKLQNKIEIGEKVLKDLTTQLKGQVCARN